MHNSTVNTYFKSVDGKFVFQIGSLSHAGVEITEANVHAAYVVLADGGVMTLSSYTQELNRDSVLLDDVNDEQWYAVGIDINDANDENIVCDHTHQKIPMYVAEMTKANFIVANMCDMDYHLLLQTSMQMLCPVALKESNWDERKLKQAVIRHLVGLVICRDTTNMNFDCPIAEYRSLEEYFEGQINITFSTVKPEDGMGSAYYDVNFGESFTF